MWRAHSTRACRPIMWLDIEVTFNLATFTEHHRKWRQLV